MSSSSKNLKTHPLESKTRYNSYSPSKKGASAVSIQYVACDLLTKYLVGH